MRQQIKRLGLAALLLAIGAGGAIIGREARSAEDGEALANHPTEVGKNPYRHDSHFTTSIHLTDGSTFTPAVRINGNAASFVPETGGPPTASWAVYSVTLSKDKKKLIIVFIAKDPKGSRGTTPAEQIAGRGTSRLAPRMGRAARRRRRASPSSRSTPILAPERSGAGRVVGFPKAEPPNQHAEVP